MDSEDNLLRVKASSPPAPLASAISHAIYDAGNVRLRAIGASAISQAVKAIAIAQSYVGQRGVTLACRPGFETVQIEGKDTTAIVLRVWAEH